MVIHKFELGLERQVGYNQTEKNREGVCGGKGSTKKGAGAPGSGSQLSV